jgi:hypothetical protein
MFKLLLLLVPIGIFMGCSSKPDYISPLPYSKEATCIENISGKGYKFLAWGIGEDNAYAETDALKAALWSAMVGGGAGNCVSIMNMMEKERNKGFIESFFANYDEWSQYVRSTTQGRIDPDKRIKLANGKVKLGVEVIVETKLLREYLEAKGLVSGMKVGS